MPTDCLRVFLLYSAIKETHLAECSKLNINFMKYLNILSTIGFLFLLTPITVAFAEKRQSGSELAVVHNCVTCHGVDGISKDAFIPNLAGQKFKYLKKQTDMFSSGKTREYEGEIISSRTHPAMNELTQSITKIDLNRIIHHYSKLICNVKPARKITTIIPEATQCEACHGGLRTSPFRDSPNLAGQKQQYMLRQLQQMAILTTDKNTENSRKHRLSELMVQGLTNKDLIKITKYYSDMGC